MALFRRIKTPFVEAAPEAEAGAPAGPRSVGDMLRERRQELSFDLDDCAAALNIKPAYLEALEDGRPERLPGPTYATGFVRAYAGFLDLDAAATLRRFKAESGGLDAKPDLAVPVPLSERSIPGSGMLMVALILVLCGYGAWYYLSTAERSRPQRVSDVPANLLPPKPNPRAAASAAAAATEPAAPPAVVRTPAEMPAKASVSPTPAATAHPVAASATNAMPEPAAENAVPSTAPAANAAATAPKPAPVAGAAKPAAPKAAPETSPASKPVAALIPPSAAPPADAVHIYGQANSASRIVIHANANSWIQVSDGDHALFTRTLRAGDSYRVPDKPGITMRTGNAGGLDITVDGHPVPSIGQPGMLRRDVALDPQALSAGSAVHD